MPFRSVNGNASFSGLPPSTQAPGRPGLSPVRTTRATLVPKDVFETLRKIQKRIEDSKAEHAERESADEETAESLTLFGEKFRPGDRFGYEYTLHPVDM